MKDQHRISNTVDSYSFGDKREISIEFGYIIDMIEEGEDRYYLALIARERAMLPVHSEAAIMPLGHTMEELTNFGAPEDLIGRRVRVEYIGEYWDRGVAFLAGGRQVNPVGTALDIPSRGFRHAVAGGGSV